jgi:Holliday junction resolvasome RuvABC endonuclease subunit
MTTIVGVDPGQTGALAIIGCGHRSLIEVVDMPLTDQVSPHGVSDILRRWRDCYEIGLVVIEKVGSMPRQGVSSTFKFGTSYGIVQGAVAALELPMTFVPPNKWTTSLHVGADKDTHRQRCIEMWPDKYDLFKLKKHDGRADAALLAVWGLQEKAPV